MARPLFKKSRKHGFTLVELLIVVAIIGVLSTVAVPTFRRMIAKSKKTEAKVNLGGLYTAEQAFLAEYGAYGNNLNKIGFQSDGNAATGIYAVGFPQGADCQSLAATGVLPAAASSIGTGINSVFPGYYVAGTFSSKVGPANKVCAAATGTTTNIPTTDIEGTTNAVNVFSQGTAESYNRFIASATGPIWPGVNRETPTLADYDIWTINHNRQLINNVDGTK